MEIARPTYLQKLIDHQKVPLIKVITGIRRAGKSYLLDPIFKRYLLASGVPADHIIHVNLDLTKNEYLRNAEALSKYVEDRVKDDSEYFVLLDEIQLVPKFEFLLNEFLANRNLNTYVTGSNSRFLSSDIITEFRGRSDEIHVWPLCFAEFVQVYDDKYEAWKDYYRYGGLPLVLSYSDEKDKMSYLLTAQQNVYLKDVIDRYNIRNDAALRSLIEIVASSTGSLTNPYKLENAFKSKVGENLSHNTIESYLDKLGEAFVIEKAQRYDVRGKQYIDTPFKYYFSDPGIRNSFLGFRQPDEGHLAEGIIYNDLRRRGYQVDVGVATARGRNSDVQYEIDFVANRGDQRYYIQSALNFDTKEIREREMRSLDLIGDSFKKFIITKSMDGSYLNDNGVKTLSLMDFLLDDEALEK